MSGTSAFHRLSEELLTMIVESIEDHRIMPGGRTVSWRHIDRVHKLRLTHPRFAYLKATMRLLFHTIVLPMDSIGLESLQRTNLDAVFPFVQGVKFLHSGYGVGVTEERVRETLKDEHDDEAIKAAHESYRRRAGADKNSIDSGRTKGAFLAIMNKMPQAHEFVIAGPRDARADTDDEMMALIVERMMRDHRNAVTACLGDDLLQLATDLILKIGARPTMLRIDCDNTGQMETTPIDAWKQIDLSQLEKFVYNGNVWTDITLGRDEGDARENRMGCLTTTIADGAAPALQHLELNGPHRASWKFPDHACKQLRYILLGHIDVEEGFDGWLAQCTSLERLRLECVSGVGMDTFWTIRNMQPLLLTLDQVICNEAMEASMEHHSSKWVEYVYDAEGEYYIDWEDALKAFLCGSADATPHLLEMWNEQDWEPPAEEE